MNSIDLIKSIFIKVRLHHPTPDDIQARIIKSRNKTLKSILKKKKTFSLHKSLTIKFYNWCKGFGISSSMRGSSIFVRGTSFAAAAAIMFFIVFNVYTGIVPQSISGNYITFIMGDVKILRNGIKAKRLQLMNTVNKNDSIIADKKSMASLMVVNMGIIAITENSSFTIKSIQKNTKTAIYLKKGRVLSRIFKSKKGDYHVNTPNCFAAVRGTRFSVYYDSAKDKTIISVTEGSVSITHNKTRKEILLGTNKTAIIGKDIKVKEILKIEKLELQKMALFGKFNINNVDKKFLKKRNANIPREIEKIEIEINKASKFSGRMSLSDIKKKYGAIYRITDYRGKNSQGPHYKTGERIFTHNYNLRS